MVYTGAIQFTYQMGFPFAYQVQIRYFQAGGRWFENPINPKIEGNYWSTTIYSSSMSWNLVFKSSSLLMRGDSYDHHFDGRSIHPVANPIPW